MRYLCLIYDEEKRLNARPSQEVGAFTQDYVTFTKGMATTIRVRSGRVSTPDGPFAETEEQLGGFCLRPRT
jgi:hypothetical protein